nr:ribosomal protein S2 [Coccidia sp. AB-2023a]
MTIFTLTDLVHKNIHLGHNMEYFNPKTNKYIYKTINKKSIIDIIQTAKYLSTSYSYFYLAGYYNQNILFIGYRQQQVNSLIKNIASITGNFYCNSSWIPGTLTNWNMIKSRLILLEWIYSLIQNNDIKMKLSFNIYSKLYKIYKKLNYNLKGLIGLIEIPEIIFILDPNSENKALQEATKLNKIIVSIVDSNINPTNLLLPIPGNDKTYKSLQFILKILAAGYLHGTFYN